MSRETVDPVVTAIYDLARIILASEGSFESKSDTIRRLDALSIPPARIAMILQEPLNNVTSAITKSKRKARKGKVKR